MLKDGVIPENLKGFYWILFFLKVFFCFQSSNLSNKTKNEIEKNRNTCVLRFCGKNVKKKNPAITEKNLPPT